MAYRLHTRTATDLTKRNISRCGVLSFNAYLSVSVTFKNLVCASTDQLWPVLQQTRGSLLLVTPRCSTSQCPSSTRSGSWLVVKADVTPESSGSNVRCNDLLGGNGTLSPLHTTSTVGVTVLKALRLAYLGQSRFPLATPHLGSSTSAKSRYCCHLLTLGLNLTN